MMLTFATLLAIISTFASAQNTRTIINISTVRNPDVGLSIFAVDGLQNDLLFHATAEGKFLLSSAQGGEKVTWAPPQGWLAGTGTFAYGTKSKSSECRLKGTLDEFVLGDVTFNIVNPTALAELPSDDIFHKNIEKCQGLTLAGIQMDCDDKTLMCEKLPSLWVTF